MAEPFGVATGAGRDIKLKTTFKYREHFLLACTEYSQLRETLFNTISDHANFFTMNQNEKLNFLVNDPSIVKKTAKFIVESFDHRSKLI